MEPTARSTVFFVTVTFAEMCPDGINFKNNMKKKTQTEAYLQLISLITMIPLFNESRRPLLRQTL